MTTKVIVLNGTNFYPTNVATGVEKKGEVKEMVDGSTRFFHKAHKRTWDLSWNKVDSSWVSTIRTIYLLTTSFTLTDEFGTSYTVLCLPGGFKHTLDAGSIGLNGNEYYDVNLTLQEA